MASSKKCGNCGKEGHFRNMSYRRENEDAQRNLINKKEENRKWHQEGKTIPFTILNKAIGDLLQILYDMSKDLDVLGRPRDWKEVNENLDSLLPFF